MNEDLSNKVLERIDADQITPVPRWRFLLLRALFWLFAILSVVLGSVAVGVMLFLFIGYREHGLFAISHSATELLLMVPYLWIAVLVLFVVIAEASIKHTKKGYKYRLRTIVFASVILSIVFGAILNFIGVGMATHELLREIPAYNFVTYDSKDAWNRPDLGRLAGVVVSIQDNNDFSIADFGGRVWRVHLVASTSQGLFVPEASSTVRMLGTFESSSSVFIARSVYEWE